MRIYQVIRFQGARNQTEERALIDTGADISMIPLRLAAMISAWQTNQTINISGVHGQSRTLPLGVARIYFPSLNDIGGQFYIAISNIEQEPIIGMDILRPLGVSIDIRNGRLLVQNEIWEAFKTLAGVGVLTFVGIKILESVFEENR